MPAEKEKETTKPHMNLNYVLYDAVIKFLSVNK